VPPKNLEQNILLPSVHHCKSLAAFTRHVKTCSFSVSTQPQMHRDSHQMSALHTVNRILKVLTHLLTNKQSQTMTVTMSTQHQMYSGKRPYYPLQLLENEERFPSSAVIMVAHLPTSWPCPMAHWFQAPPDATATDRKRKRLPVLHTVTTFVIIITNNSNNCRSINKNIRHMDHSLATLAKMCAHIYGKRTLYNLWHSYCV